MTLFEGNGRIAVVTGASQGIGRAIAETLAAAGCHVWLVARTRSDLEQVASHIEADGGTVTVHATDLTQAASSVELSQQLKEQHGGLDILINNAGIGTFQPLAEIDDAAWDRLLATNVSAVFRLCRALLPLMSGREDAAVVNVSSMATRQPFAGGTAYCASKAALDAFSESLFVECRPQGIRVSTVAPGSTATHFSGREDTGADWKILPQEVADAVSFVLAPRNNGLISRVEIRPQRLRP